MTSLLPNVRTARPSSLGVYGLLIVLLASSAAGAAEEGGKAQVFDPNDLESLRWLPLAARSPANPLPEAEAEDEAGMKPYTEVVAGADVEFDMVPIPGGKFLLGSPEAEADRSDDEGPQVEVEVEPFWRVSPLTFNSMARFDGSTSSVVTSQGPSGPNVSAHLPFIHWPLRFIWKRRSETSLQMA